MAEVIKESDVETVAVGQIVESDVESQEFDVVIPVGKDEEHGLHQLPDGHVDENGERIVYEYDGTTIVGWHKESA